MRHYIAGTRLQVEPELRDREDVAKNLADMGYDLVGANEGYRVWMPRYSLIILAIPKTGARFGGAYTRLDGHISAY